MQPTDVGLSTASLVSEILVRKAVLADPEVLEDSEVVLVVVEMARAEVVELVGPVGSADLGALVAP